RFLVQVFRPQPAIKLMEQRAMADVVQDMVNQETGVRGYLVAASTGNADAKFLEPYKNGKASYEKDFARVKDLTSDNPAQQARLAELDRFAKSWQKDVADREIALTEAGDARGRELEASGAGKTAMDGLRAKAKEIEDAEASLLDKRSSEMQ